MRNPFEIMKQVEEAYFLPKGSICKLKKGRAVSEARHVAMFLCRKYTKFSFREIAAIFLVDYTSVIYGVRKISESKDVDVLELIANNV